MRTLLVLAFLLLAVGHTGCATAPGQPSSPTPIDRVNPARGENR